MNLVLLVSIALISVCPESTDSALIREWQVGAELARPSHDRAPLGRAVYSDLYYRRTSPARTSTGTGARAESSPLDKMAYLLSRLVLGGVLGVTEGWVLGFLSKRWTARRTIWRHYSSTSF